MFIYFVYNTVSKNELVYIGQTRMTLALRRGKHFSEARKGKGSVFGAAIRKYGQKNFNFVIHSYAKSQEELNNIEINLIANLRPRYNMQEGGQKSFSPWNKGLKMDETYRNKCTESAKGRLSPKRGNYTNEHRNKIAEGGCRVRRRAFICNENSTIYYNKVECAKDLGIHPCGISAVLMGTTRNKSHQGYSFKYIDDVLVQGKSSLIDLEAEKSVTGRNPEGTVND